MPCTPEKRFPGARPDSLLSTCHAATVSSPSPLLVPCSSFLVPQAMDPSVPPSGDSLEESRIRGLSLPSFSGGSATKLAKKPLPLRIVVPPTEYCPFSTDFTLPCTPLSLPTPVSSSCFTFSDTQELANESVSAPPTPCPVPSSCPPDATLADFASPTSSQFLLMPPTPHWKTVENVAAIYVSPPITPCTADGPAHSESRGTKSGDLRPWGVSSSTWLSDLGGHTETDRIFRHNLLEITSNTDSSPASTPALSPSAISPASQASSVLAHNSPTSLAKSPASLPPTSSQRPCTMSPQSPARLVLKSTGTDTFPSTLDSLQAWRENVTPGLPQSEGPPSPLSNDVHSSQLEGPLPEALNHPSLRPYPLPPRVSKSQTLIKHAKTFGGRVKRLVARQSVNKHRSSMDRGVNFRVVTSQDSENGSVILITAPPPPYDDCPPTLVSRSPTGQEYARSRTISEYSSAVQTGTVGLATACVTEPGSRRGSGNRNALRRLSFAALSTIKRF